MFSEHWYVTDLKQCYEEQCHFVSCEMSVAARSVRILPSQGPPMVHRHPWDVAGGFGKGGDVVLFVITARNKLLH